MKKEVDELEDELRPEYEFAKMQGVSEVNMFSDIDSPEATLHERAQT